MSSPTQAVSLRRLRVFLCHSSDDKPKVRELYRRLKDCNVDPWLDTEKLLPGQVWDLEIQNVMRKADMIVICLSRDFILKESYGQKEIKWAVDIALEKPDGVNFLVPLKLEECELPQRLKPYQGANYFEEDGFDKLIRAIIHRRDQLKEAIEPIKFFFASACIYH